MSSSKTPFIEIVKFKRTRSDLLKPLGSTPFNFQGVCVEGEQLHIPFQPGWYDPMWVPEQTAQQYAEFIQNIHLVYRPRSEWPQ